MIEMFWSRHGDRNAAIEERGRLERLIELANHPSSRYSALAEGCTVYLVDSALTPEDSGDSYKQLGSLGTLLRLISEHICRDDVAIVSNSHLRCLGDIINSLSNKCDAVFPWVVTVMAKWEDISDVLKSDPRMSSISESMKKLRYALISENIKELRHIPCRVGQKTEG